MASFRMLFSGKVESEVTAISTSRKIIGGGAIGIVIGFIAGLLGIGGGVFIVPLLIYILRVPTKIAAATSIFIVVFSLFSGFAAHVSMVTPDWELILLAAFFFFYRRSNRRANYGRKAEKKNNPPIFHYCSFNIHRTPRSESFRFGIIFFKKMSG